MQIIASYYILQTVVYYIVIATFVYVYDCCHIMYFTLYLNLNLITYIYI